MTVSEVSKYAPGLFSGEALPGTPKANQFKVYGNGETAISHVKKLVHHSN